MDRLMMSYSKMPVVLAVVAIIFLMHGLFILFTWIKFKNQK
jgi:hypothetical protein